MLARIIQAIVAEIQRRRVLQTVAVYAVAAWLVLQVAEVTFPHLGFPSWSMRTLILGVIVGFPLVFILAWSLQVGPKGLKFDLPLWRGLDPDQPRRETKSDLVVLTALLLLLGVGIYGGIRLFLAEAPLTDDDARGVASERSIAVLMFENFSSAEPSDHFGGGLAEEILNLLVGIGQLDVAARTSSFQFRGEQVDIRDVARALGVKYVLEGSFRKEGDRIRVTAQLINGHNNFHEWSEVYERRLEDIFAIQEEIASAVVNELKIVLSLDAEEELQRKPTGSIDAYVYYLQGRDRLRNSYDQDVMQAATTLFNEAVGLDPAFARAWGGICEAQLRLYKSSNDTGYFDSALAACDRAQELDPTLDTDVSVAIGKLYASRGWLERAETTLRQAIDNSPTSIDAHIALGEVYTAGGRRDEAEAAFLRAVEIRRQDWRGHYALFEFYYDTERYDEAIPAAEIVVSLMPESAQAASSLGAAYWIAGELAKAADAYSRSLELKPSRQGYTNMGLRLYYAGQFERAAEMQTRALDYAPDDHRVWGRLAESYRFVPGKAAEALEAYSRAAELAEKNLAVNDQEWETHGLLAIYYAHLDRSREARRAAERCLALSQRDSEALYYVALALQRLGDTEAALDALEEAVASDDQYRQFIATDPDLRELEGDSRFQLLLPAAIP